MQYCCSKYCREYMSKAALQGVVRRPRSLIHARLCCELPFTFLSVISGLRTFGSFLRSELKEPNLVNLGGRIWIQLRTQLQAALSIILCLYSDFHWLAQPFHTHNETNSWKPGEGYYQMLRITFSI